MESLSKIEKYDWFDVFEDGIVYVKYLNAEAISVLDGRFNVAFSLYKNFDASKYVQVIETE